MSEENIISANGSGEQTKPENPPTDFKIAEIWVRSGQVHLDAVPVFWEDKIRSLGILEVCKTIVINTKPPKPEQNKIITDTGGIMNFVRNGLRKKKR